MIDQIIADAERFSKFLVAHYPPAKEWEDPVGYCAWYIGRGYIAVVVDDDEIVALCAMRPVDRPGFGVLPYYFNEDGKSLHIDLLIDETDDLRSILNFRRLFMYRFGPRETVTMFRHTESAMKVYPFAKFWNNLVRVKRGKIKKENRYGTTTAACGT